MKTAPVKEGKHYRFRNQEFWAQNGRVWIEDQRDGEFKSMTSAEFAARAIAFGRSLKEKWHCFYEDERTELSNCVQAMCACVKETFDQGDPHQEGVSRRVARDCGFMPSTRYIGLGAKSPKSYFLPGMPSWMTDSKVDKYICNGKPKIHPNPLPGVDGGLLLESSSFQALKL